MIRQLTIRDFRSISSQDIDTNRITTFVGANDAGKSNLLRALNLFFNGQTDPGIPFNWGRDFNQFSKIRRGKARQIEIKLKIDLPESYKRENLPEQVEWVKYWRESGEMIDMGRRTYLGGEEFPSRSKIPALLDRYRFTYVPAIKDRAFFSDLQGRLYDILASVAAKPLRESAQAFETQIQTQLAALLSSISEVFDGDTTMRLPENLREIFENLEISSGDVPLSRRGDGIKMRHIPMLLRFIAKKHDEVMTHGGVRYTHVWGFEEPENNVEMTACFKMAETLNAIVSENDHNQLFMTTHSPIFYRMPNIGEQKDSYITTYFVEKQASETRVIKRRSEEVDEAMGLMPIVAPFVQTAKERYDQVRKDRDRMRELAQGRCPTLFVEGSTDKAVLTKALQTFYPNSLASLHIHDGGEDYGGATALANRSLAWLLEMRHRAVSERVKAISLFDQDDAGKKARSLLVENMDKHGLKDIPQFRIENVPKPDRLVPLLKQHFRLSIDLEALYPDDIWTHAKGNGWLEGADPAKALSPDMLTELVRGGKSPILALPPEDSLRLQFRFSDGGKVRAARHISKLNQVDATRILQAFRPLIERIVTHFNDSNSLAG